MSSSHYPSLYQINTRVWLTELSRKLSRTATLDDIPDAELRKALTACGYDVKAIERTATPIEEIRKRVEEKSK